MIPWFFKKPVIFLGFVVRIQVLARRESNRIREVVRHCCEIRSLDKEPFRFAYALLALPKRLHQPIPHVCWTHCSSSTYKINQIKPASLRIYWKSSWDCWSTLLARARLGGDPGVLLLLLPLITPSDNCHFGLFITKHSSIFLLYEASKYQSTHVRD